MVANDKAGMYLLDNEVGKRELTVESNFTKPLLLDY